MPSSTRNIINQTDIFHYLLCRGGYYLSAKLRGVLLNYIDLFFIVIFFVIIFAGYLRGFAVSLLALVRTAVSFSASFMISSFYGSDIYNALFYESLYNSVTAKIHETGLENSVNAVSEFIDGLPSFFSNVIRIKPPLSDMLGSTEIDFADQIMKYVVNPVGITVVKVLLFIISLIVLYIIFGIIIKIIKDKSDDKDAPFHKTNKFLGAVFGLVKAIIIVFSISAILYFIAGISEKNVFVNEIETSLLYNFIVKYNPIIIYLF